MPDYKKAVKELLRLSGVTLNGGNAWDVQVHDDRVYARVLSDKGLGLGESYMEGWWDCPQLDELIYRVLSARLDENVKGNLKLLIPGIQAVLFNRQRRVQAREAAERHYDLGNDLFFSFLDPYNQYSCAYFNGTNNLEEAQLKKLALICGKLGLVQGEHLLDVGFGWGGLARYASEHCGCSVTGVNISEEQVRFAREFCQGLPVELLHCDYRDIRGSFDKVVSVGMFEHVGHKNYRTFMNIVHRALKDDGIFLLDTMGINESRAASDAWTTKYIFPSGQLPSMARISRAIEGLFVLEDLHNLGPQHDKTFMAWNERFQHAWPALKQKYDNRFKRMWEYYLLSFAGAFRARTIQVWQLVLTKYYRSQPACRALA